MKKEISILGQNVTLAFNLAAQIAYEDITGKAFELTNIKSVKDRTALYMACIIAGDENTNIKIDQLLTELKGDELIVLDNAVAEMIKQWIHIPDTAQKEEPGKGQKHADSSRAV